MEISAWIRVEELIWAGIWLLVVAVVGEEGYTSGTWYAYEHDEIQASCAKNTLL